MPFTPLQPTNVPNPDTSMGNFRALNQTPLLDNTQSPPIPETLSSSSGFFKATPNVRPRDVVREIVNMFTSSESGLGQSTATAIAPKTKDFQQAEQSVSGLNTMQEKVFNQIKLDKAQGKDTTQLEKILHESMIGTPSLYSPDILPAINTTGGQVAGQGLGTALDIASFGTYGALAKFATTGKLLNSSLARLSADLAPVLGDAGSKEVVKNLAPTLYSSALDLMSKLPSVGKETMPALTDILKSAGKTTAIGTGAGYGYDVSQNLQAGQTGADAFTPGLGTLIGVTIPAVLAGAKVTQFAGRKVAPSFVNSLLGATPEFNRSVKLGHNPGEAIVQSGIVANSLPELEQKVAQTKSEVGQIISGYYSLPENLAKKDNYSSVLDPLNAEIAKASQSPLTNKAYITRLENVKADLLNSTNLADMNPQEAFNFKQKLIGLMKFTGAPSDDKGINAALNGVYGAITEKVNKAVPELIDANKLYGGLSSAEISASSREQRNLGKNMLSLVQKFGATGGVLAAGGTAVATGGFSLLPILAGLGGAGIDKLLSTTAVKTRVAQFLGGAEKSDIQAILRGRTIQDQQRIINGFRNAVAEEMANRKQLGASVPEMRGAIPMGTIDKSGIDYKRVAENDLYLKQLQMKNTLELPAPPKSMQVPNVKGTPNPNKAASRGETATGLY